MYQEFNQYRKADTVKWIVTFVLIIALMGGVIASIVLATNQNKVGNTGSVIELDDGSLLVNESDSANDGAYAMPKKLMFAASSSPTLAAKAGHTVSIKLTATVTPIEAENKTVDWSVAWVDADANKDKNVADYVTVTPESDGSATATVVCKKAFDGSEIQVADLRDSDQHIYTFMQVESGYAFYNKFYIENGKLKIVAESAYSSTQGASYSRSGSIKTSFASYKDNKLPYVLVTVTEQNTGLTATICVCTTSGVQGVSLSSETLYV